MDVREIVNGLMYGLMCVLSTGRQWRAIPKDLPPRGAMHDYFDRWDYDGALDRVHHGPCVRCRGLLELHAAAASPKTGNASTGRLSPSHAWTLSRLT